MMIRDMHISEHGGSRLEKQATWGEKKKKTTHLMNRVCSREKNNAAEQMNALGKHFNIGKKEKKKKKFGNFSESINHSFCSTAQTSDIERLSAPKMLPNFIVLIFSSFIDLLRSGWQSDDTAFLKS